MNIMSPHMGTTMVFEQPLQLTISPVGLPSQVITFQDLQQHFDKPLAEVARHLNMCTTVFKVS